MTHKDSSEYLMKAKRILSTPLQSEMESIRSNVGAASLSKLRHNTLMFERLKIFCRRALAETHLVSVASAISREFSADLQDMQAIGVPVDILEQFPEWRHGSTAHFQPKSKGLKLVSTGAGKPITTLRLQLSPASPTIPYAFILIRDLLRRMDHSVRFYVVVEPGANIQGLRQIVRGFSNSGETRVRFVEGRSVTIFAQDNALAARDKSGNPVLMIPRSFCKDKHREEDELSPEEAEHNFGIRIVRSQLFWEGGNITHDGHCCLIGVDTVGENMARLGLTESEVLESFEAEFGSRIACLGDLSQYCFDAFKDRQTRSGQVSYHIDLDVSLLGRFGRKRRPRALIADPARGLDLLPAVLAHRSLFTKHFMPANQARELIEAEYEEFARERHPKLLAYNSKLEELGYMVIGVPDLRIDPKENLFKTVNLDFSYCNILPGLWHNRPAVYYLPWGIRTLDLYAERRFHAAGAHPVRISSSPHVSNALMKLYGGLHCFCGQLM